MYCIFKFPFISDVEVPVFEGCPTEVVYFDSLNPVTFSQPTVSDNSHAVKSFSVNASIQSGDVLKDDVTVRYAVLDYNNNLATCDIRLQKGFSRIFSSF